MERRRAFTQTPLFEGKLEQGLSGYSENEIPQMPVLVIALEPPDCELKWGIRFCDSFDNLDYLKVAVLEIHNAPNAAHPNRSLAVAYAGVAPQISNVGVAPQTPSAFRIALIRHRGSPTPGTDICAPEEIFKHDPTIVSEVVDALGLHPDDVLWSRPHDD